MKVNPILMIIAIVASLLVGYTFYLCWGQIHIAIGSAVASLLMLGSTLGISCSDARVAINQKVVSFALFFVLLVQNIICAMLSVSLTAYIIMSVSIVLIWVLISYLLSMAKKDCKTTCK